MAGIAFRVNGTAVAIDLRPSVPLAYVLRNDLGLTATRLGCASGHCGACTVLLAGTAVQSCTTPLAAAEGQEVETAEALAAHPLRDAFLRHQAAQCGYCTNGIMMTVKALLDRDPPAEEPTIVEVLAERHLCRCGVHPRILRAIRAARSALAAP